MLREIKNNRNERTVIMGHKTKWCQKSDVWSIDLMQSCLTLCHLTDRTVHGFSRPEYCSRWPFPSSGDFPNPGAEPRSSALQADFLPAELLGKPRFNQFHYKPQWAFFLVETDNLSKFTWKCKGYSINKVLFSLKEDLRDFILRLQKSRVRYW